jgi:hypothetical protein
MNIWMFQNQGISIYTPIFQDLPSLVLFFGATPQKLQHLPDFHGKFMNHTCLNQLLLGRSTFFLQSLHLDPWHAHPSIHHRIAIFVWLFWG